MRCRVGLHPRRLLTAPKVRATRAQPGRSELLIDGLVCSLCALRTERALQGVPGVQRASVDLARGRATVEHRGAPPEREQLAAALEGAVIGGRWRRRIESLAGVARQGARRRQAGRA